MLFQILSLLLNVVGGLLTGACLLRWYMQQQRVSFNNPLGQLVLALTSWMVLPLRKLSKSLPGGDWASLIGAFLIVLLASSVLFISGAPVEVVLLKSLQRFLQWILYGFMALLIIEAIFSWVNPHAPLAPFVRALNEPLLRPLRKVVPLVGSLDLSLLVALILLQIAQVLVGMIIVLR